MARPRVAPKWACAAFFGLALLTAGARDAPANDPASAARDVQAAGDFRVRVSAALYLGRSRAPGARTLLEAALADAHPAVRAAAAASLAALGDRAALPALRARAGIERSAGTRSQVNAAIAALSASGAPSPWDATRYVVAIGGMHNRAEVGGSHASDVLRSATRTHAQSIPGALVSDLNDSNLLQQAEARHVPVFLLEGAIQRLHQGRKNAELSYNAQVDYSMRKVPQHQLHGVLSGSATSFGSVSALHDPAVETELEDQAIEGAAESALRGAARGFGDAVH